MSIFFKVYNNQTRHYQRLQRDVVLDDVYRGIQLVAAVPPDRTDRKVTSQAAHESSSDAVQRVRPSGNHQGSIGPSSNVVQASKGDQARRGADGPRAGNGGDIGHFWLDQRPKKMEPGSR